MRRGGRTWDKPYRVDAKAFWRSAEAAGGTSTSTTQADLETHTLHARRARQRRCERDAE